jgi:aryl-alcohol dehydrogenase-like predicted oxidoreductase
MQTRSFGRTGHQSTVAIFGAAAFSEASQAEADPILEQVIAAGVNHFDIAPSYGNAEKCVGPWMPHIRDTIFLGCKTMERTKDGAAAEFQRSLKLLQVDHFDLYQFHAVTTFEELDEITRPGGALEAVIEARRAGLTRFIGITGHGFNAPLIYQEALRRFDFDSILFPINFVQYANPVYRENSEELVRQCRRKEVGLMIIKSICRAPWGERPPLYNTWYEPFTEMELIQKSINFALSQAITGICTPGEMQLVPKVLAACEAFTPINTAEQEALIATADQYQPLFTQP